MDNYGYVKTSGIKVNLMEWGTGLFFIICFFKSFWFNDSINVLLRAFMFMGLVFIMALSYDKEAFTHVTKLELMWLFTLGVPIMSRLFTSFKGNSIKETLGFTTFYISTLIFAVICGDNKRCIDASFSVMKTFLSFLVMCTILFYFLPSFYLSKIAPLFNRALELTRGYESGNMAGFTAHYSTNGMYMALAFIMAFAGYMSVKNCEKKIKYKQLVILLITVLALLMTGKRAHSLFSITGAIVAYFFYSSDKPRGRIIKIILFLSLLMVLLFSFSLVAPGMLSSIARWMDSSGSGDVTTGRIELWSDAFDYFKEYPFFGIGFKQFIRIGGMDVHNVFLQLFCETGLVGAFIYIIPMTVTFIASLYTLFFSRVNKVFTDSDNNEKYMIFNVCYQVFFLSYCVTGNPLYDLPTLFPYMLCVGITLYYRKQISLWKLGLLNETEEKNYGY